MTNNYDLSSRCGRQRILVSAEDTAAEIRCYKKNTCGAWRFDKRLGVMRGFVGRNGASPDKREGDGKTPAGAYGLGFAFGVREKPATRMFYRRVTPASCWVDDPQSPAYNRWVEVPEGEAPAPGWNSAERLGDYPDEYAYAVVIEYNTENTIPGRGSAVFLHCGSKPTSGCVAVPEADMLRLLGWLDPAKNPVICIEIPGE
jgi:L,D-peptidoglycan transpeptidase YkuD (ErfK/YbiS/YcfS/YnhG family)